MTKFRQCFSVFLRVIVLFCTSVLFPHSERVHQNNLCVKTNQFITVLCVMDVAGM